jgi:hypothetical protein
MATKVYLSELSQPLSSPFLEAAEKELARLAGSVDVTVSTLAEFGARLVVELAAARAEIERLRAGLAEAEKLCFLCDGEGEVGESEWDAAKGQTTYVGTSPCPRCGPLRAMVEGGNQ